MRAFAQAISRTICILIHQLDQFGSAGVRWTSFIYVFCLLVHVLVQSTEFIRTLCVFQNGWWWWCCLCRLMMIVFEDDLSLTDLSKLSINRHSHIVVVFKDRALVVSWSLLCWELDLLVIKNTAVLKVYLIQLLLYTSIVLIRWTKDLQLLLSSKVLLIL